ncbi:MAG: bifunctional adenosylcobinamide kinase/adenosylcobinamide-phosphate guanylyltransferase [Anaerolineaceae bacterium]|nr:bifunctional adenosylcobinamide kinase/adenosylcobinamide-phosphate guanylyltransferase [Anaerolineaceae bacterium]
MAQRLIFLLGGARGGKSHYAEQWARQNGKHVLFVATAQAFDDEMQDRIARHRAERPADWHTLEAPLNTGSAIGAALNQHDTVLVDCVTLLASNVLLQLPENCTPAQAEDAVLAEVDKLLNAYHASTATWLIISNEVGMGIVPPYRLGRLYRDALGRANQRIAEAADEVLLLVAGIGWQLKP